jgi:hypothetical protein
LSSSIIAYGTGIESELAFDACPRFGQVDRTIDLHVERVAVMPKLGGTLIKDCVAQGRAVDIVYHDDYVSLQIDQILIFEFRFAEHSIRCKALYNVSEKLLEYWILQQMIPIYLLMSGVAEFLHGMAVSTTPGIDPETGCIAFLGESGAGKSTLLGYLMGRGHALVTDDHLVVAREDFRKVYPAPPFYRPYRAAEDQGIPATLYSAAPTHLDRIYLLKPALATTEAQIEELHGFAAVMALNAHIRYTLHNPKKPDFFPMVENRFRGLSELARRVPIARIHVPRSLDRLDEVYRLIQQDSMRSKNDDAL